MFKNKFNVKTMELFFDYCYYYHDDDAGQGM
jgi:hypothetical protein